MFVIIGSTTKRGIKMKNTFTIKGVEFEIGEYTPRRNEFERGVKYQLFVNGYASGFCFSTKHEAKAFAEREICRWL